MKVNVVVVPAKGNVLLVACFAYALFFAAAIQSADASWLSRFFTSRLQIQTLSSTFDNVLTQPPSQAPSPAYSPLSSPTPAPAPATTSPQAAPAPAPQSSSSSQFPSSSQAVDDHTVSTETVAALGDICDKTDYPELCRSSVTPFLNNKQVDVIDHISIIKLSIDACVKHTQTAIEKATELAASSPENMEIIQVCQESYSTAVDALKESALALASNDLGTFRTEMSSVITSIGTCDETFGEDPEMESSSPLTTVDQTIIQLASNILAIGERI